MSYLLWAVFGGFILHFLLANFLTVTLKPKYEKAVDTAADVLNRNITIVRFPGGESWIHYFANSADPVYRNLSQKIVIAKDWYEYNYIMVPGVILDGTTATIGTVPHFDIINVTSREIEGEYRKWYRSSERLPGLTPYVGHQANKKWPLQKVFKQYILSSDRSSRSHNLQLFDHKKSLQV